MKKIIVALFVLALGGTGKAWATAQARSLGVVQMSTATFTGAFTPMSRTLAQVNTLQATATGQILFCSDCVNSAICVSSGIITPGAWVVPVISTGNSGPYTGAHCK